MHSAVYSLSHITLRSIKWPIFVPLSPPVYLTIYWQTLHSNSQEVFKSDVASKRANCLAQVFELSFPTNAHRTAGVILAFQSDHLDLHIPL